MNGGFRTRVLGGTLLVIKGLNDCATFERGRDGRFHCVNLEGDWTQEEIHDGLEHARDNGALKEAMSR